MGTSWGTAMTYTGQIDEGIAYNENNCEQALKTTNLFILGLVGHELVLTLALVRDIPRARTWGDRIYPHLKKEAAAGGMLRRPLSLVYSLSGEVSKGKEVVEAELDTQKISLYGCYFEGTAGMGLHYLRQGEWNEAQPYLDKAIPFHETRKNFSAVGSCLFVLGSLNMEQGNVDQAEELLTRSLDICRNGGNVLFELWVLPVLVELYLKKKQSSKAEECVERGFDLLKPEQNWYGLPAGMYLAKGILAGTLKNWDEAESCFEQAIQINRQFEMPWDEAKVLFEWGLTHAERQETSDRQKAQEKLDKAQKLFEQVGARHDIAKVTALKERL